MAGTEERVSDEVYKEDGYVYSLEDDGFVWKTPTKDNPRGKRVRVDKVDRESGFKYHIDKEGYLVRTAVVKREAPSPKSNRQAGKREPRVGGTGAIEKVVSENKVLFGGIGVIILLLVLGIITLMGQLSSQNHQYNSLQQSVQNISQNVSNLKNSNYLLRENLSNLRNNYYTVEANYTSILNYYKALLYNVSNPYVETLANNKSVDISGYRYNSSYSYEPNWAYYKAGGYWYMDNYSAFNTSFNLPYYGYLVINLTSTLQNNASGGPIPVYFSQQKPYFNITNGSAAITVDRYIEAYTTILPAQSKNYIIPVSNGTTYMIIYNDNSSGTTITYNIKYVGFYNKVKLT